MTKPAGLLSALRIVLAIKIVGTVLLICLPMLALSAGAYQRLFGLDILPELALRLLGTAYLALTIAYWTGYREASAGRVSKAVLCMGIVSNLGALSWIAWALLTGDLIFEQLRPPAFILALFVGTVGFSLCALWWLSGPTPPLRSQGLTARPDGRD